MLFPSNRTGLGARSVGLALLVAAATWMVGCSGPQETATSDGGPSADETTEAAPSARAGLDAETLAEVETFDASRYPVRQPTRSASIEHVVPTRLMRLRADEGITETVEGFRVQVYSATSKQSAEEFREEVQTWIRQSRRDAPEGLFTRTETPVVIQYSQPYYRVRIGAFTQRKQAREALEFIRAEYTDAFIARSTVTVTR
jgi:cell division septation protein DedD